VAVEAVKSLERNGWLQAALDTGLRYVELHTNRGRFALLSSRPLVIEDMRELLKRHGWTWIDGPDGRVWAPAQSPVARLEVARLSLPADSPVTAATLASAAGVHVTTARGWLRAAPGWLEAQTQPDAVEPVQALPSRALPPPPSQLTRTADVDATVQRAGLEVRRRDDAAAAVVCADVTDWFQERAAIMAAEPDVQDADGDAAARAVRRFGLCVALATPVVRSVLRREHRTATAGAPNRVQLRALAESSPEVAVPRGWPVQ